MNFLQGNFPPQYVLLNWLNTWIECHIVLLPDGGSDKLAEVPCEPGDGGGMAVRELGVGFSGRGGPAQLWDGGLWVCWRGAGWTWMWFCVSKVWLRTSRAKHFALDPGLAWRGRWWLCIHITAWRKIRKGYTCMFLICPLLFQFTLNMVCYHFVMRGCEGYQRCCGLREVGAECITKQTLGWREVVSNRCSVTNRQEE